jgi:hypothetical protein
MKKQSPERILGRKLARELTREELEQAGGATNTWTTSYPADGPYNDSGDGGGGTTGPVVTIRYT